MYHYTAYGLVLESELALAPLEPAPAGRGRDAVIRRALLKREREEILQAPEGFVRTAEGVGLHWDEIGTFVVRGGREILVEPSPAALDGDLEIALLGPALAALLDQRGYLLLHASGVVLADSAVLFLGSSGWGKSSMASALQARGHPAVVDDLAAVSFVRGKPHVQRGVPQLKLWPDSVAALGQDPDALPRIGEGYQKRRAMPTDGFTSRASLPLARIYVLDGGPEPTSEALSQPQALLHLTAHSYGIRWFLSDANRERFADRSRLARSVPCARLARPPGLELLPRLARMVEEDCALAQR